MACGTPVVAHADPALREVAGDAARLRGARRAGRRRSGGRSPSATGSSRRASSARARFTWDETARRTLDVYREVLGVKVSAVVVSHGHRAELAESLPALAPQVDELVVIANVPGSEPADALRRPRDRERAAAGLRRERQPRHRRDERASSCSSPTRTPCPSRARSRRSREFVEAHPRCGRRRPAAASTRTAPGSRRGAASRPSRGTIVRRTPLRRLFPPLEHQRAHYHLDERPTEPVEADWMLGGSLLLRRAMLDELGGFDEGFRLYGEDIDLCYRAAKAGWERWYVPEAVVRHRWDAAHRPSASSRGGRSGTGAACCASCASTPRLSSAAEAEDPLGEERLADPIRAGGPP